MIFSKLKKKNNSLIVHIFSQSTKSHHFLLRGKVGQLRKRKRVLCLSIYIISLWCRGSAFLWVHPQHRDSVQPLVTSHNYQLDMTDQFFFQVNRTVHTVQCTNI